MLLFCSLAAGAQQKLLSSTLANTSPIMFDPCLIFSTVCSYQSLAYWRTDAHYRCLRQQMHEAHSESEVIWYDAITIEGKLQWQNCLNGLNEPFFDVSDGLFVNYHWNSETPKSTARHAGEHLLRLTLPKQIVSFLQSGKRIYSFQYWCPQGMLRKLSMSISSFL